ncbi:MAG: hypothetical protein CVV53_04535 [Spirochaetae bacterium HGW-Spirochaetae-9]|nr:MAG: hypothetical protein CVV53_04535 [Spirochaetae bacterium HGW-Spirochaetae-9]
MESSVVVDKNPHWVIMVRKIFSGVACAIAFFMVLCLILLVFSQALRLESPFAVLIFDGLRYGAVGLFAAAVARFFLDIMYGIFGLLQAKVASPLRWFAFSLLSLIPLALIFAFMRLAEGFRA